MLGGGGMGWDGMGYGVLSEIGVELWGGVPSLWVDR